MLKIWWYLICIVSWSVFLKDSSQSSRALVHPWSEIKIGLQPTYDMIRILLNDMPISRWLHHCMKLDLNSERIISNNINISRVTTSRIENPKSRGNEVGGRLFDKSRCLEILMMKWYEYRILCNDAGQLDGRIEWWNPACMQHEYMNTWFIININIIALAPWSLCCRWQWQWQWHTGIASLPLHIVSGWQLATVG